MIIFQKEDLQIMTYEFMIKLLMKEPMTTSKVLLIQKKKENIG